MQAQIWRIWRAEVYQLVGLLRQPSATSRWSNIASNVSTSYLLGNALESFAMHQRSPHSLQCTGQLICRLAVWRLVLVAPPAAMDWRHLVGNSPTYCGTLAQPHSTQYYYTAHSTFPPTATDRTQNRRSKTQISWPSHFSSVAAFQQKIVLHIFAVILKP